MASLRRSSLLARFSVMALLVLAALGIVLGQLLTRQIETRALANAETAATLVAGLGVQANLSRYEVRHGFDPERLDVLDRRLAVDGFGTTGALKVKIFDGTPTVVYAKDRSEIGRPASHPAKLARVLEGREVVSNFVRGVEHDGRGERTLEVMVPLRFGNDPLPAGVYEVYLSFAGPAAAIRADTRDMYVVLVGGLLVLYAALYRIVAVASRRLRHQASHDALTGLPNRDLLSQRVDKAVSAARRGGGGVAVMLIDLDRFKEVNDALGHSCGDELLRQVAPRLADVLRSGDTLARLGGDEFAVLLPDAGDRLAVEAVAARLQAALHRSFEAEGVILDVEASIGVALSPAHGTSSQALLRHADVAMYTAKERKAGAVVFEPDEHVAGPSRLRILGDLRRALGTEDQLFLHFQPKVGLDDERVLGVEALLRWRHPDGVLVPPGDFIEIAEGTGLILRITDRVLDLALAQARAWLDGGDEVPVAVNLSTRCLLDSHFPQLVRGLLDRHGVPAHLLCLEITESALMGDAARTMDVLERLHALGVRLSLDDFGTGYSSMSHLRRLPVKELKVDRSFVMGMLVSEQDAVLVRTAIDLGHNLGLTVVAEGVETPEHVEALRALGCDVAQGYWYARPMLAQDVTALLATPAQAAMAASIQRSA